MRCVSSVRGKLRLSLPNNIGTDPISVEAKLFLFPLHRWVSLSQYLFNRLRRGKETLSLSFYNHGRILRAHQQKVNFAGFLFVHRKGTFCELTLFKNTITTKIQSPLQEISSLGTLLSFKREEIEPKSSHPRWQEERSHWNLLHLWHASSPVKLLSSSWRTEVLNLGSELSP